MPCGPCSPCGPGACAALALLPGSAWPQGTPPGPEFRVNTYTTLNQKAPSMASEASDGSAWSSPLVRPQGRRLRQRAQLLDTGLDEGQLLRDEFRVGHAGIRR